MANPQPEPFVRFSKELFDAIMRSPLEGTHLQIVLCVVRRTYGDYGKTSAPISLSLLRQMTGRSGKSRNGWLVSCLDELISEGVVRVIKEAGFRTARVLALNKDYETWGRFSTGTVPVDGPLPVDGTVTVDGPVPVDGAEQYPSTDHPHARQWSVDGPIEDNQDIETREDSLSESAEAPSSGDNGKDPEKPARVKKKTPAEWQAEHDRLMAACHFASDVQQLAEIMAAANKTGQVAVSRVVRELLQPIVTMQDEISDPALRHGLRAAITARAPNANYVRKAAAGHRSGPGATSSARATSGVVDPAWHEQIEEAYSDD